MFEGSFSPEVPGVPPSNIHSKVAGGPVASELKFTKYPVGIVV